MCFYWFSKLLLPKLANRQSSVFRGNSTFVIAIEEGLIGLELNFVYRIWEFCMYSVLWRLEIHYIDDHLIIIMIHVSLAGCCCTTVLSVLQPVIEIMKLYSVRNH